MAGVCAANVLTIVSQALPRAWNYQKLPCLQSERRFPVWESVFFHKRNSPLTKSLHLYKSIPHKDKKENLKISVTF